MRPLLSLIFFLGVFVVQKNEAAITTRTVKPGLFDGPGVFLTVSADASVDELNGALLNRLVEVNWYNLDVNPELRTWIGLFDHDPTGTESIKPIARVTPTTVKGKVKTRLRFDVTDYRQIGIPEEKCRGYWVAYFIGGTDLPLGVTCLKIFPDWMIEMRDVIGLKTLDNVMIPGTHDSGAWKIYEGKVDDDNMAVIYSRTQEDNIYTQLVHGIRYFDLRIAHYPDTREKFWINHGDFRQHPLQNLIDEVNAFVRDHHEVIILDVHGLPVGFSEDSTHLTLIDFLEDKLGPSLYRKSSVENPTFNDIWNAGKTVILTYPREFSDQHDFLWPRLDYDWGNTNKVDELEVFFTRTLQEHNCHGQIIVSSAALTPNVADILLQPSFGVRGFAQLVNSPATEWFQQPTWYERANIVISDYYLGTDMVQMAMKVNLNGVTCAVPTL